MARKNGSKPDTRYQIDVDIDEMTISDAFLQAKFALAQSEIGKIDDTDQDSQISAMRVMVDVFEEMTGMLDRVAVVQRDGQRIAARLIPQHLLPKVMQAISDAQQEAADPND